MLRQLQIVHYVIYMGMCLVLTHLPGFFDKSLSVSPLTESEIHKYKRESDQIKPIFE